MPMAKFQKDLHSSSTWTIDSPHRGKAEQNIDPQHGHTVGAVQWIPACALPYGIAKAANDIVVGRKLTEDLRHMDWWSTDRVCLSKHPKDAVWRLWHGVFVSYIFRFYKGHETAGQRATLGDCHTDC